MAASLARIPLIRRRLRLQFREQGGRQVLPLNTENVASVFQIVPLNKKGDYGISFGAWLEIPNELHSQPLRAAGWYVDEGKCCSWRWIVVSLDRCNETNVSDYLLPYVESPADPSLTVERVKPIMMQMTDWAQPGVYIIVPRARAVIIRQQHESEDEQRAQASIYYVHVNPFSSWHHLARILYHSSQPKAAVDAFRALLPKPKDPTLTPENVISVMEDVEVWDGVDSARYLDMPYNTHLALHRRHGSRRVLKIALIEDYLSHHPYPRWEPLIELVEDRERWGKARAGLAQEIKDKYITKIPEEAQAIIDKALESGSLKQRNLIVTITGIMGAGKTCFLRQLFSLKPPSKYSSTGVAEKSCRGLMHHVAEMGSFQILSHNEVHEFLAPFLSSAMVLTDTTTSTSEEEVSEFQTQSSVPYLGSNSSTSAPFIRGIEGESPYEPIQSVPPTTESLSINREAQPVPEKSFASEAINFALRAPKTAAGTCLQLLDVIDTGGQPEFMETMPCVIHNSNLTALVLNIAQSLDTCPKVTFHRKGKGFRRGIPFPLTNRQIIENLARTMQAKRCIQEYGQKSKLMVIFTHCDSLWRWRIASTIAAVNREIKKIFIPAFQNELIVYRSVDEIGFPVNCLSPDAKDKIVFQQIRENISKVSVGNEMMVPPSFLMFEHDLMRYAKELGRDILSFNECMQVGVHLNMSEKVVQAALIYFHQHNIFLYFPKVLPRLVFTDPQVPLNFVNNVVAFSYLVNCGEFAGLPAEYSLSLRNGIILEEMLTKEPLSSCLVPGIYESVHAITLFKHLRVIAVINEDECDNHELSFFNDKAAKPVSISFRKQRFLMPCMLPIEKNVARCLPQSPVSKFVVRFNNDCVPNGVFGGSIATLLTVHGWKICKKEDGSPQCMTHDIVTLHDPLIPARITYMNATRHCEIYIDARNFETCVNACPLIRSTIFSALHSTFEVMHFDCTVEDAFPCPCKVSNKLAHAAITCNFKDAVHLKCSISGEPLGLAEEKCVVWLAPVQQPTQTEATGTAQSGKPHICTTLVNRQSLATTTKPLTTEAQPLQEKKERLASTEDKPTMPELIRFETSLDVADDKQTVWLSQVPTPAKVTNTASSVEKLSPIVDTGIPSVKPYRLQKKKERLASTEDKPTLPELIAFKTQSGNINIMEGIGMHYHQLGPLLLKDGDGSVTDAFIDQYHLNAARINHEILKRWLGGTGLKPV